MGLISETRFGGISVTVIGSAVSTVFVVPKHTSQREGEVESWGFF